MTDLSRRRLVVVLAALGVPAPALAWSETKASLPRQRDIENACGATLNHRDLLAEVERLLAERGLGEAERKQAMAALTCPTCGCPVSSLF
ncbi:MAG: hypothetical protein K2Q10_13770 [Rhodospirillales bacterium]|nr:hypothetical protein [Rhodospirillales bacterium]